MSALTAECSSVLATSVTVDAAVSGEPDESAAKRQRIEFPNSCSPAAALSHSGFEQLQQDASSHASSTDVTQQLEVDHSHTAVDTRELSLPCAPAAAVATAAIPSLQAPASNADQGAEVPTAPTSKRMFPCRVEFCSALLASTSNRARHERTKHGVGKPATTLAAPAAAAAVVTAAASPPREQYSSMASAAMSSPFQQASTHYFRPALSSYLRSPSLARGWQAASGSKRTRDQRNGMQHEDGEHASESDVDVELLQFVAAAGASRRIPSESAAAAGIHESHGEELQREETGDSSGFKSSASASSPATDTDGCGDTHEADESELGMPGMPALLTDEALQAGSYAFLQWVCAPSLTPIEALVKARRVRCEKQLLPIKRNLRFIFLMLNAKEVTRNVDLSVLTRINACQALWDALNERGVGSGRMHTVFLLVKKVLVHLSSVLSVQRRQYLPPTMYDSWLYVDGVCSDAGQQRKQESRNRAVLGSRASQQLLQQENGQRRHAPEPFVVPKVWNAPVREAAAEQPSSSSSSSSSPSSSPPSPAVAPMAAAMRGRSAASPDGEMTKGELQLVTKYCLANLQACMEQERAPMNGDEEAALAVRDRWFMALLVTGVLCFLAPRSQVLAQLRIGSTLTKHDDDGRYWIQLLAQHNKNNRPTVFVLPVELTAAMDFHLQVVRPRLLTAKGGAHDYVFVKRDGSAPRTDYTGCTHLVTQQVLGPERAIGPHAFRSAVITAFYPEASQCDREALASIMAHDVATARAHYNRPVWAEQAIATNDKMARLLLGEA